MLAGGKGGNQLVNACSVRSSAQQYAVALLGPKKKRERRLITATHLVHDLFLVEDLTDPLFLKLIVELKGDYNIACLDPALYFFGACLLLVAHTRSFLYSLSASSRRIVIICPRIVIICPRIVIICPRIVIIKGNSGVEGVFAGPQTVQVLAVLRPTSTQAALVRAHSDHAREPRTFAHNQAVHVLFTRFSTTPTARKTQRE
jgi:hypothetical protein